MSLFIILQATYVAIIFCTEHYTAGRGKKMFDVIQRTFSFQNYSLGEVALTVSFPRYIPYAYDQLTVLIDRKFHQTYE